MSSSRISSSKSAASRFAPGERIGFAAAKTPFGWAVVGATARGLCWLALAATKAEAEASLRAEFPQADLRKDNSLAHWIGQAIESITTPAAPDQKQIETESLDLRGTAFQLRVWKALGKIPRGQTRTYGELARALKKPTAARAVARACATNRVSLLVPCHRVVGATGALTGYRWGVERKQKLLLAEVRQ